MKVRQFITIMGVVALVAVIYSPSTIGISGDPGGDGGSGPSDTSPSGTSMFLSDLRASGYHVVVANTSQQVTNSLSGSQKKAYFLLGADSALSNAEVQAVQAGFRSGTVSILVAEGNDTNAALLSTLGASASGSPITDPLSPFKNPEVFVVALSLGPISTTGVIDIASPLRLSTTTLHPVASTSRLSYDGTNPNPGPRTVVAAGITASGARALVITDSAPFTNFLFNFTDSKSGVDEKAFVSSMVSWVDPANATVVLDASHYNAPKAPQFQFGIPIGPLVAYALEQNLAGLNGYYNSFPSQVSGFLGGFGIGVSPALAGTLVAAVVLISVYGAITRWFAQEKRGRDDQPAPSVEKTIVAESAARLDFLQTSRSKSLMVATLAQLYEVLDSIVTAEFGKGLSAVDERDLAQKVGPDGARRAKALFLNLSKLHDHATGKSRLIFPPVLRWRALASRMTRESEEFLNQLGMTIAGQEEAAERQSGSKERVEYLMRARVRA